jgi:hypothetical protein
MIASAIQLADAMPEDQVGDLGRGYKRLIAYQLGSRSQRGDRLRDDAFDDR